MMLVILSVIQNGVRIDLMRFDEIQQLTLSRENHLLRQFGQTNAAEERSDVVYQFICIHL